MKTRFACARNTRITVQIPFVEKADSRRNAKESLCGDQMVAVERIERIDACAFESLHLGPGRQDWRRMRLQQYVPGDISIMRPLFEFALPRGKHDKCCDCLSTFAQIQWLLVRQHSELTIARCFRTIETGRQRTRMNDSDRFFFCQSGVPSRIMQARHKIGIDSNLSRPGNRRTVKTLIGIGRSAHDLLKYWIVFEA
ncbi:MAG: hypothetical protein ABL934_01725 [Lysobacteraceae bacterium]